MKFLMYISLSFNNIDVVIA